jgi:hypothetical protein
MLAAAGTRAVELIVTLRLWKVVAAAGLAVVVAPAAALGQAPPPAEVRPLPPPPPPPPSTPAAALRRGLEAFEYGQHAAAVAVLRPLIEGELLGGADRLQALRAYAVSQFLLGQRGAANGAFLLLLQGDANARLDPALVPPEAISFFEEVRVRNRAAIARVVRAQRLSAWPNLLPPLGQFQNRQPAKGWLVLGLEVGALALNLSTYFVARSMPGADGTVESESRFTTVKTLNSVGLLLVAGVVVYGIVDGFYYYRARAALDTALAPSVTQGGGGLSVGGRF